MKAYEFSTKITPDGKLVIPDVYAKNISIGDTVRVIVLVGESKSPVPEAQEAQDKLFSLEKVIADIKIIPPNSANIQPASGLLAEHLAKSPGEPDPSFDVVGWNKAWDKVEAEMEDATNV